MAAQNFLPHYRMGGREGHSYLLHSPYDIPLNIYHNLLYLLAFDNRALSNHLGNHRKTKPVANVEGLISLETKLLTRAEPPSSCLVHYGL